MTHLVTLDTEMKEIDGFLDGSRSMIIRGSDTKIIPYGIVSEGDVIYFAVSDGNREVMAKAVVTSVYNSYSLSKEESFEIIIRNQDKLALPDEMFYRWAGKKFLILIGVADIKAVVPFRLCIEKFRGSEGWLFFESESDIFPVKQKTA